MTQETPGKIKSGSRGKVTRALFAAMIGATFAMLIAAAYFSTVYERGDGLSVYEREAIAVVSLQNDITGRWNQAVDTFNDFSVQSEQDHVILFTLSLDSVHDLITDSQSIIEQWKKIEAPEKNVNSYELGLEALMAMQDGLILFEEYFQNSIDTLVADQIRAGEAEAKLVQATELWQAAARVAALEG